MKVAQLCAVDFTLFHFLLPLMRGLRQAGHEVVGISSDGKLLEKVRGEGFRVETVPLARSYNPLRHLSAFFALIRLLRHERFDILHVHTPVAALVGRLAGAVVRVPRVVYTAHGFYFHEHMAGWKYALFVAFEWLAGRFTDVLFTQSAEDAETARRLGLCRTGFIEAIGNGSNPQIFHPAPAADAGRRSLRESLGFDASEMVIITVGRLVAEKGYPELIQAMRDVEARLWVVGERLRSDHASSIDEAIVAAEQDPVLAQRIRFLGYRSDIPALLRAADIFVLASHREGMPRSIIEAMLTGLPVVATDIRGAREEVVPGETGLLVPVNDPATLAGALATLTRDGGARRRYGQAGRVRAIALYDETKVVARQLHLLGLAGDIPSAGCLRTP
jgi:glycosyltransferase involved in cell wall biosynthesis